MARIHITSDGEMADEIAWRAYGDRPEGLIALLEANPILARSPPMLPAGLRLVLPDLPEEPPAAAATIRIFT
nr:tail protein X [uncultured Shinella sp.]